MVCGSWRLKKVREVDGGGGGTEGGGESGDVRAGLKIA
jgi:hypothetical protein